MNREKYTCAVLCLVVQSCPILCDPIDGSPPGSPVPGILQARILEWVAMPSSRGSSQPRDWTQVSLSASGFFTIWATRETHEYWSGWPIPSPGALPNPGIKPGSPALQEDSLSAEVPGKPDIHINYVKIKRELEVTVFKTLWYQLK